MSNTKIISKSSGTMDVEYYEYVPPLDRIKDIKDAYDPKADEALKNAIQEQRRTFYTYQENDFKNFKEFAEEQKKFAEYLRRIYADTT